MNKDRIIMQGITQETGLANGIEGGAEFVNMGGHQCATLQHLQHHISHHMLPELLYVSTAIGMFVSLRFVCQYTHTDNL